MANEFDLPNEYQPQVNQFDLPEEYLPPETKFDTLNIASENKKQALAKAAARKEQILNPNKLPSTRENFLALYPNATEQDLKDYDLAKASEIKQEQLAEEKRVRDIRGNRDRTAGEILTDTISALGRGVVDVGGTAYGLTNLATKNQPGVLFLDALDEYNKTGEFKPSGQASIDKITGFSKNFAETKEIISKKLDSDPLKLAQDRIKQKAQERAERNKQILGKDASVLDKTFNTLESFGEALGDYADDPLAAVDASIQSLPQMIGPGAITGVGTRQLTNQLVNRSSKEVAERFLKSEAGKQAVNKIATRSGLSYIAVSEGISNGLEVQGQILKAKHEDLLKSSDYYRQLIDEGMTPEKAKRQLADEASLITTGVAGLFGAITSKLTGAAKFEGNLFRANSPVGKSITGALDNGLVKTGTAAARGTIVEGVEETLQGASGAFASNLGKTLAKDDQSLLEGVADSAAGGLVSGSLSGGVLGGTFSLTKSSAEALDKASTTIKEQKKVEAAISSEDLTEITNTEAKTYNPENAFLAQSHRKFRPTKAEDIPAYIAELEQHAFNMANQAADKIEAAKKSDDEAGLTKANRDIKKAFEYMDIVKGLKVNENLTPEELSTSLNQIIEKQDNAPVDKVFGSMGSNRNIDIEDAKKLSKSEVISPEQKTLVDNYIATEVALNTVEAATKDIGQVSKEIIQGDNGNLGIKNYLSAISTATEANNKDNAEQFLTDFTKFADRQITKADKITAAYNAIENNDPNAASLVEEVKNDYDLDIQPKKSKKLVDALQFEKEAFNAALNEANFIFDNTFKSTKPEASVTRAEPAKTEPAKSKVGATKSEEATPVKEITEGQQLLSEVKKLGGKVKAAIRNSPDNKKSIKSLKAQLKSLKDKANEVKQETSKPESKKSVEPKKEKVSKTNISRIKELATDKVRELIKTNEGATKNVDAILDSKPLDSLTDNVATKLIGLLERVQNKVDKEKYSLPKGLLKDKVANNLIGEKFEARKSIKPSVLVENKNYFEELDNSESKLHKQTYEKYSEVQRKALQHIAEFEEAFNKVMTDKNSIPVIAYNKNLNFIKEDVFKMFFSAEAERKFNSIMDRLQANNPKKLKDSELAKIAYREVTYSDVELVDRNLISQMALVTYNWLGTRARTTLYVTNSSINSILGKDSKTPVKFPLYDLLAEKGTLESRLTNNLGRDILRGLGIKAKKDTEGNLESKMEIALGQVALAGMIQMGMVDRTSVPSKQIEALDKGIVYEPTKGESLTYFVRVKTKKDYDAFGYEVSNLANRVKDITTNIKNGEKILDELFGIESHLTGPTFEVPADIGPYTKNTRLKIPKRLRKVVNKHQKQKNVVKQNVYKVFDFLDDASQLTVSGYVSDFNKVHFTKIKSVEGVNASIERQVKQAKEFVNTMESIDKEFYFAHEVWKNNRIGMVSNTVNTQASKVHRHLFGIKDHEISFNPNQNPELERRFLLAAAQSFGMDVDKDTDTAVLNELRDFMAQGVVRKAVAAIQKINDNSFDKSEVKGMQQAITEAVKLGSENVYSLDGLVAMTGFLKAKKDNTPFSTNLFREVDGITNGVVLGLIQLMGGKYQELTEMLPRGGVFFNKNDTNYNEWYQKKANNDSYQDIAKLWSQNLEEITSELPIDFVSSLKSIIGDLYNKDNQAVTSLGRKLSKDPVMVTNYGASVQGVINDFTEEAIGNLYDRIASSTREEVNTIEKDLSILIDEKITIDDQSTFILIGLQEASLRKTIKINYGNALKEALQTRYSVFYGKRTKLNNALRISFEMFKLQYDKAIADYKSKNGVTPSKEKQQEIFDSLKNLQPLFATPLMEDKDTDSGILVMKTEEVRQNGKEEYENTFKFGFGNREKMKSGDSTISGNGYATEVKDGRVSGVPLGIHSIDAAIMTKTLEAANVLNVHDSIATSIDRDINDTKLINEAFFETIKDYNLPNEILNTLKRNFAAFKNVDNKTKIALNKKLIKIGVISKGNNYVNFLKAFNESVKKDNERRELLLANITSVIQYNNGSTSIPVNSQTTPEVSESQVDSVSKELVDEAINQQLLDDEFTTNDSIKKFDSHGISQDDPINITSLDFKEFAERSAVPFDRSKQEIDNAKRRVKTHVWPLVNNFITHITKDNTSDRARELRKFVLEASRGNLPIKSGAHSPYYVNRALRQLDEKLIDFIGNDKTYQSSPKDINPDTFKPDSVKEIEARDLNSVFQGLEKVGNIKDSKSHRKHLSGLVDSIYTKVIEPITLKVKNEGPITYGSAVNNEVYLVQAVDPKINNIQMSAQETMAHELMHIVTSNALDNDPVLAKETKKLFEAVEKHIKPEDFLNDPADASIPSEMKAAKERYDYIFNNQRTFNTNHVNPYTGEVVTNKYNNYLHEFVAMGTTNENFMRALSKLDARVEKKSIFGNGFVAGLMEIIERVKNFLQDRILKVPNLKADAKLRILAEQLAGVHKRKANLLGKESDLLEGINNATLKGIETFVTKPLTAMVNSKLVQNSKVGIVKSIGVIGSKIPTTKAEAYYDVIRRVRRRQGATAHNFIDSLFIEAVGQTAKNAAWHKLAALSNKMIDQNRKAVATNVANLLLKNFSSEPSNEEKTSLNKAVLKTDLSSLMADYKTADIIGFLEDDTKRIAEINRLNKQLKQFTYNQHYYRKMAESLGSIMATGKALERNSMLNAYNIATLVGAPGDKGVIGNYSTAESIIDKLATLHAITYTDEVHRKRAARVANREASVDAVNNGFTFTLQIHRENKKHAAEKLFGGRKTLVVKGYTKELYNPNVTTLVAPIDDEAQLLKDGYRRVKEVQRDVTDPNQQTMYLYVNGDGLVNTYMAGTASFTNKQSKGTDLIESHAQVGTTNPGLQAYLDLPKVVKANERAMKDVFSPRTSKSNATKLVPIVNELGKISGYRYMMTEENKDIVLEKDNSFETVLGSMEASIEDKTNSESINRKIVQEAFDEYKKDYNKNPEEFVFIGKTSSNERYAEIYQMMPKTMRDDIKRIWGTDGLYLKDSVVDLVFGYRKFSVTNIKKTDVDKLEPGFNKAMAVFGNYLADLLNHPKIKKTENIWQEIVKIVKDTIVIKSGIVLAGNVGSNLIVLSMSGVPIKDIIRDHTIAITSARQYQADTVELDALKRSIKANPNLANKSAVRVKIARLENEISNNPVKELIDAGVYQSIVEDVDSENEQFTYKNRLDKFVEPVTNKLPTFTKTIAKNVFMTHDTGVYKFMRESTQLSDFVARYTLHQHQLKKGMSKEESINEIVRTFVNYDLPTHRGLQYANDIGFVLFTKFLIRTQRVLVQLLGKHPGRVFTWIALQNFIGDVSDIYDTNIITGPLAYKFNVDPIGLASNVADVPVINLLQE